jgi:hypothetical protein
MSVRYAQLSHLGMDKLETHAINNCELEIYGDWVKGASSVINQVFILKRENDWKGTP